MSIKYELKPGFKIYFLTVWFKDTVYSFGPDLGFTDIMHIFAIAETEEQHCYWLAISRTRRNQRSVKLAYLVPEFRT